MASPRPILKRSEHQSSPAAPTYPRSSLLNSNSPPHGVHFPPSPTLTRTFSAYSSTHYDRSPIVVTPNSCALPERGCPGRTYTLDDPAPSSHSASRKFSVHNGRHLHPRAYRASSYKDDDSEDNDTQLSSLRTYSAVPPLIPDLSSESEESDGPTSSMPEPAQYPISSSYHHPSNSMPIVAPSHPPIPHAPYMPYSNGDNYPYFPNSPNALSFLPHPASPKDESQKARRRKQRDQSRSRDERPSRRVAVAESYKSLSVCKALSNCSLDDSDDGCLGGF